MKHIHTFIVICFVLIHTLAAIHSKLKIKTGVTTSVKTGVKTENKSKVETMKRHKHRLHTSSFVNELLPLVPGSGLHSTREGEVENELDHFTNSNAISNASETGTYAKAETSAESGVESTAESAASSEGASAPSSSSPDIEVKLMDWLTISSQDFRNQKKFPVIVTQEDGQQEISVARDHFQRLNFYNFKLLPKELQPPQVNIFEKNSKKDYFWFWFRASDRYMYYSATPQTLNQLGAFSLATIRAPIEIATSKYCFDVEERSGSVFRICGINKETKAKWFCHIQRVKKISPLHAMCGGGMDKPNYVQKTIIQPVLLIPTPSKTCNEKWSFQNNGKDWDCTCKDGNKIKLLILSSII